MLIDLTCPAEIFQTLLPTEDIPAVTLTLYNLSDRVIASVEVTVRMLSAAGAEKERMTFRGRALNGRPHSTFPMNVPMAPAAGVRSADVIIDKVWFADKDVWRRSDENLTEYEPNALPVSIALTRLKYTAGETAVGYPDQQDGVWVCVCGRPNPDLFSVCARCRRDKAMVFTLFNRDAVENQVNLREKQLDLSTRSAREDTARLQRIREEEYNQNKVRRAHRLRLAGCLALCLALIAGLLGGVLPALRMIDAASAMQAGRYTEALETLTEMPGFPGAQEQIRECRRQIAARLAAESTDPEELEDAVSVLREDAGDKGSIGIADQADVRRARMRLDEGDIAGARAIVSALPEDDEGRKAVEADCSYLEASNLLDEKDYSAARVIFLSLGDYPGAAEMAAECVYRAATDAYAAGEYENAITLWSQIPGYQDSRRKTLMCHYTVASALEKEARDLFIEEENARRAETGDEPLPEDTDLLPYGADVEALVEKAAAEYLYADDWSDAKEKTQEMNYILAAAALARKEYARAQQLFGSIPGYLNADDENMYCIYRLGYNAMAENEYTRAYEWFILLPEDYEDVKSLRQQAAYHAGCLARKLGDDDKALEMLKAADDYRDSQALVSEIEAEQAGVTPTPEATPAPTATPEPTPAPTPTPTPVPTPTPEPTPTPTPAPTREPTPAPYDVSEYGVIDDE